VLVMQPEHDPPIRVAQVSDQIISPRVSDDNVFSRVCVPVCSGSKFNVPIRSENVFFHTFRDGRVGRLSGQNR